MMPFPFGFSVPYRARPMGYAYLVQTHALDVVSQTCWSFLADAGGKKESLQDQIQITVYPPSYGWEDWKSDLKHILFSLKYDGLSIEILDGFFQKVDLCSFEKELLVELNRSPSGKYLRRIWFLYEYLLEKQLAIPDLSHGNYIHLLEEEKYITGPSWNSRRQRVRVNLLGGKSFCPLLRRTPRLEQLHTAEITQTLSKTLEQYSPDLLVRAVWYLYTKETKASFEIESETPSTTKAERFVLLLKEAERLEEIDKETLLQLQQWTVDPRYADDDYRKEQVYVGESIHFTRQLVHYIAPKPEDVSDLMTGLLACYRHLIASEVHPILVAACISFGFVFIHPFRDGNGRIHRFLIHHILSRMGLVPKGLIVPVSAVMLNKRREYDACLESFSRPLMRKMEYQLNDLGQMRVLSEGSARFYRYMDMTRMAEDLFGWIIEAIEEEMHKELQFLSVFRDIKKALQEIVDMPNPRLDLLIKLILQNQGKLSKNKRAHFSEITEAELSSMEAVITAYLPSFRNDP